jgi:hypothetical protein
MPSAKKTGDRNWTLSWRRLDVNYQNCVSDMLRDRPTTKKRDTDSPDNRGKRSLGIFRHYG